MALILVMIAVAIAAALSASFLAAQSTSLSISRNVENNARARYIAESGLRLAVAYVNRESDWRTIRVNGTWVANASFVGGTYTIVGEDGEDVDGNSVIDAPAEGDGDLADDETDVVTLSVTGRYNGSSHLVRAVIVPRPTAGDLLFVVGSPGTLTAGDTIQKGLFEDWGWTVSLIDDNETQSEFATSAAANDVIMVGESASAAAIGTKLKLLSTGVVLSQISLGDEFGLTQVQDTQNNRHSIDIVNGTHPITSPLGTGSLDIFTADLVLHQQKDTIATGATVLANHPVSSKPSLYVVEVGGLLYGGGTATGRRVQLPWGQGTDYTTLTAEGKTILRRALEWAGQASAAGLIAHWRFDETSGTAAADSSGSGYDGVLRNMNGSADWVTGYVDGALDFDRSDDYVEVATFPNMTGSMTITAWINPSDVAGDQRIFCDDRNNTGGYALSLGDGGNGRIRFFSRPLNPVSVDGSAVVTAGAWQFIAGVHDAAAKQRRIYVGSTQVGADSGSYSGTWGTDAGSASIGGEVDGTSEGVPKWRFGGRIDDVRVYDRALSATEIAALASGAVNHVSYTYKARWIP